MYTYIQQLAERVDNLPGLDVGEDVDDLAMLRRRFWVHQISHCVRLVRQMYLFLTRLLLPFRVHDNFQAEGRRIGIGVTKGMSV